MKKLLLISLCFLLSGCKDKEDMPDMWHPKLIQSTTGGVGGDYIILDNGNEIVRYTGKCERVVSHHENHGDYFETKWEVIK